MLFKSIISAAFLAATVAADGAAILKSLATVDADLAKLNTTVIAFNGDVLLAVPILAAVVEAQTDLKAGTKIAENSAALNTTETLDLVAPVDRLVADANLTLSSLVAREADFASDDLTGIIKSILVATKADADAYSAAIIAKVPSAYTSIADALVAPLDTYFDTAIDAFS